MSFIASLFQISEMFLAQSVMTDDATYPKVT